MSRPPRAPMQPPPSAEEEERLEKAALLRVASAFRGYRAAANAEISRWEAEHSRLPPLHAAALAGRPATFAAARWCAEANASFIDGLLDAMEAAPAHLAVPRDAGLPLEGGGEGEGGDRGRTPPPPPQPPPSPGEDEKVRYVLRNLSRDWSVDGAAERGESYGWLLFQIATHLPPSRHPDAPTRVLVPGAGMARLPCELALRGYAAEGNECSFYCLLAASHVMNSLPFEGADIFPWALTCTNNVAATDALRPVHIPDLSMEAVASSMPPNGLSMAAGDFDEVYSAEPQRSQFDCVATCFFIDTTHSVLRTIDTIFHCLRPGGVWANVGPLLYHWADAGSYLGTDETSVEPSLEEVLSYASSKGFIILSYDGARECGYGDNVRSMMRTRYRCAAWAMRKPE